MAIVERLATSLEHKDEQPNIDLAYELVEERNQKGIEEIINQLSNNPNKKIKSDCIKVLYEVGSLEPELVSKYVLEFIELLKSRHNRLVWGAMTALGTIAHLEAPTIYQHLKVIQQAMTKGSVSVITVDHGVKVLAMVASTKEEFNDEIFPILLEHLRTCRTKEIPQHAESSLTAVNESNKEDFLNVLREREQYLTPPQQKRVKKIYKQLA